LNPSRPYILPRERESGQLLITSILVLLFNFEVLLKKNYQKKVVKKRKRKAKRAKKATTKKGLCVCFTFFCVAVLCDYLCV
jgi:hypothetical protein